MAQMPQDDLEPLITECPSCQTRFRVSDIQLQRARGRVRCGACLTVFDGVDHLVADSFGEAGDETRAREALDDLLDELAGEPPEPTGGTGEDGRAPKAVQAEPPLVEPPVERQDAGRPPAEEAPRRGDARNGSAPAAVPVEKADRSGVPAAAVPTPAAAPEAVAAPATVLFGEQRRGRPLVWAGIVLGLVLLAVQVLWYQFDEWATQPAWRGVYASLCGVVGCELPVQRDLAELSTRNLVVRSHPERPDVLQVNAVIVNGADFPQPFPVLELQFTTVRGNLVASRRYHPDEYLAGDAAGMALIPARTPVQIALAIDDPGPHAVNYRLNFR